MRPISWIVYQGILLLRSTCSCAFEIQQQNITRFWGFDTSIKNRLVSNLIIQLTENTKRDSFEISINCHDLLVRTFEVLEKHF